MKGKDVAEAVGTAPSVISKWREYLMGMKVPHLEEAAVDKIRSNFNELKQEIKQEAETAPVVNIPQSADETKRRCVELKPSSEGEKLDEKKLNIQVCIDIGKGRVHLEAENAKALEILINMLVVMGGRE